MGLRPATVQRPSSRGTLRVAHTLRCEGRIHSPPVNRVLIAPETL